MSFDPRAAMRKSVRHLKPYYRAPDEPLLRLDQNTNIIGRNPAIHALSPNDLDLNQYPTRDAERLLSAIETRFGLPGRSVLAGNGSDEILDIILKAFTDPGDKLATPAPAYSLYPFYAALHGLEHVSIATDDAFDVDVDALPATGAKAILVASPNNPTGRAVARADLERLISRAPGIVIIDEAYIEFSPTTTVLDLIRAHRNLIVMRTFSKAYALAGARLGWLAAHPDTAAILALVKPPFNVGVLVEDLGVRALSEQAFVEATVRTVGTERPRLAAALASLGFHVVPSDANFLLTFPPEDAPGGPQIGERLRVEGIAARVFPHVPRLERAIRFTIGRAKDNDRLVGALRGILQEVRPSSP